MTPIDFSTCTALDVIERSAVCHPTLFVEALRNAGHVHARAAVACQFDPVAKKVATRCALDCHEAADKIGSPLDELTFGEKIQAFTVAARLQCIPHATAADIVGR